MIIEPFSKKYQHQVIDLILDIQQNEFKVPITLDDQQDLLTIPGFYQNGKGNFWIALNGDELIGTIAPLPFSDHEAALRKMFVKKAFRGKKTGTGQTLFNMLLMWSREKNIKEIYLGTLSQMVAAQKFYAKNGFTDIDKQDLPEKYPAMHVDSIFLKLTVTLE